MHFFPKTLACLFFTLLCAMVPATAQQKATDTGWPAYGDDPGGSRFSSLDQIKRSNVAQLMQAWVYHTGALQPESELNKKAAFESTPILVQGKLYLSTPFNQVIALDPATGKELWKYDPQIDRSNDYSEVTSRGVSAWMDAKAKASDTCRLRLFMGTIDGKLISLDGQTGKYAVALVRPGKLILLATLSCAIAASSR
jgi:quinoprotein glucose dehydrogenase